MARQKINWAEVKKDFFLDQLASLQDIARKHKISYSSIRKMSMREKWLEQKKKVWKKADKRAAGKIEGYLAKKIASSCKPSLGKGTFNEQRRNNNSTFM